MSLMAIRLYTEPHLENPIMFCGWPGIGDVGLVAIDTLRKALHAKPLGEIEPWHFFGPETARIEQGFLKHLRFPSNKFYYHRMDGADLIFFVGERQPTDGNSGYGQGHKAYALANLVLDVGQKFGCRTFYTSGAAVRQTHHIVRPRVWAVPNHPALIDRVREYENTILMSEVDRRVNQGTITGLNGLLLGVARKRGLDAVCLMGEVPYYLQGAPWPYPRASKSVLEVVAMILSVKIDLQPLDELAVKVEQNIQNLFQAIRQSGTTGKQVLDEIDKLRHPEQAELGPITEDEQKDIIEHMDELFRRGGGEDEKRH